MIVAAMLSLAAAIAVPLTLVVQRRLTLARDFFFFALYFEVVVYMHLAPMLAMPEVSGSRAELYAWLQLAAVMFFDVPLALTYAAVANRRRRRVATARPDVRVSEGRYVVFAACVVGLAAAFAAIAYRHGLFFRRIGHEALARESVALPYLEWAAYRLYGETGLILLAVLLIAYLRQRVGFFRKFAGAVLLLHASVYGAYVLANNRLQSVLLIVFAFGLFLYWNRRSRPLTIPVRAIVLVSLAALYSIQVVLNVRHTFLRAPLGVAVLNPFMERPDEEVDTPLRWRLNCVDLIAQITPQAQEHGFALGRAWTQSLSVLVRSIYDRAGVEQDKLAFRTNAKSYLMSRYTGLGAPDYFSCALTDAYGNYAVLGFLIAALALGTLLAWGTTMLQHPTAPLSIVVGIVLVSQVLAFEKELLNVPTGWIRTMPMILLILVLRPLRVHPPEPTVQLAMAPSPP